MQNTPSTQAQVLDPQATLYRPYEGEIVGLEKRTMTILFTDFRMRITNVWIIVLEVLAWMFFVPVIYLFYSIALVGIDFSSQIFGLYYAIMFLWLALICTVAGSRLISDDLASNAITLYLSRPIKMINYYIGKFGSIYGIIATISILPSLVLAIMIFGLTTGSSELSYNPWAVGMTLIVMGFLIALVFSSIAVLFSSITKNHLYSGVGIFCTIFFSNIIPQIIFEATDNKHVNLISIWFNLVLIADKGSGFNNIKDFDWPLPMAVLLVIIIGCNLIAFYRLNKMELSE